MTDFQVLNKIFKNRGFDDFMWIKASKIQVAQWVRFKCMFGCTSYGKKGTCPPQVPPVAECREFFAEYDDAVIFHFSTKVHRPEDRVAWCLEISERLFELEKEVFMADYPKALVLFMDECRLCASCTGSRQECRDKVRARPGPESLAVDVFSTVKNFGFPINVLKNYQEIMHRYAFLMVK